MAKQRKPSLLDYMRGESRGERAAILGAALRDLEEHAVLQNWSAEKTTGALEGLLHVATRFAIFQRPGPDGAGKIFISHASADQEIASKLAAALEGQNTPAWLAPRDVPPGADWNLAILHAIANSRACVVLLSAAALNSEFVRAEIRRAVDKSRRMFVVPLQDGLDPAILDARLTLRQMLRLDQAAERIAVELENL